MENAARANGRDIRLANKTRILRFIYRARKTTKQQLAKELGMSLPTVLQNVKELIGEGFVREEGQMESTGGRKAVVLAPVPEARFSVGVDLTKDALGLGLIDLCGALRATRRLDVAFHWSDEYFDALGRAVRDFLTETGTRPQSVLGVGFSVPGTVRGDGDGLVTLVSLDVYGRTTEPFRNAVGFPCAFQNDADAACYAEAWMRNAPGDFAYLMLCDLVGGALFLNGQVYGGRNNRAGEFGHMRLIPHGKSCYCGMEGCADAYLSTRALIAGVAPTPEAFFERLDAGDADCADRWSAYVDALSIAVTNLNMAFDCPVVLGGRLGGLAQKHLTQIRRCANRLNLFGDGDFVEKCLVRREACAVGAAIAHVDAFLSTQYGKE